MKSVAEAALSPNEKLVAYSLDVPRKPEEKAGISFRELHLIDIKSGKEEDLLTGNVRVTNIQWKPDGSAISFLMKKDEKSKTQVWIKPLNDDELKQLTSSESAVLYYQWHPSGNFIAYIATTPESEKEKFLKEKGYDFIFYEEDWKHRNLYLLNTEDMNPAQTADQLTDNVTVWEFRFSPDGSSIAASISEKNLIDYRYMFQKVFLLDIKSKNLNQLTENPGKLGNFMFSPDGKYIVYTGARSLNDHAVSQVFVQSLNEQKALNLTPPGFKGHITWAGWKDSETILYYAKEGVWNTLNLVNNKGTNRRTLLNTEEMQMSIDPPDYTPDFKNFMFVGESATFPSEVFFWQPGKKVKRLSFSNEWLSNRVLGAQKVVQYPARDGIQIEGLLIYPVNYNPDKTYPLIVIVHGGPESNYSYEWLTSYSRPGQILAGKGYSVFYPNYRGSTGYGLEYAMKWHMGNAAGVEFDDVADGIDYLVDQGIADRNRVGLGGGSYGGFAAAWFASYYTQYVQAVFMFVGISDLISKRGTTDIPYEELYVHSGEKLEQMWELSLKRSPIYYAHESQTAVLILGGTDDPRVSPSQSLEFYTRLKMNNHPAYRLIQYPGEKHGNRNQPARIDFLYRILEWFDWYVKNAKPLNGPMPPLDISDRYGLDFPE
ncbi:MAG: S9 family peptidase [Calditrichaeota bacterium]|nr:S9 family peptidase [Calditrichota bacterium]